MDHVPRSPASRRNSVLAPIAPGACVIRPGEQRLDFDRAPNYPLFRHDNRGLERPIMVEPGCTLEIDIIVDDTIATLYVGGIELNARMYRARPAGASRSMRLVDGRVVVEDASLAVLRHG